jgi:hypothetical protein
MFEEKVVKRFVQCHVFAHSLPGRRPNNKYPATFLTAPNLCKNVSLAVLFGSNDNKYAMSTQSDMYVYIYIIHIIVKLVGKNK